MLSLKERAKAEKVDTGPIKGLGMGILAGRDTKGFAGVAAKLDTSRRSAPRRFNKSTATMLSVTSSLDWWSPKG